MKKVSIAVIVVLTVLTIQSCDDNGSGTESVALRCGDIFTASSRALKATQGTMDCDGTAITLEGAVTLDLNENIISCDGSEGTVGIRLSGQGTTVKNGIVENCEAGVLAQGSGMHTIQNVEATNNFGDRDVELSGGFVIVSDNNALSNIKATGNDPVGLQLVGDSNEVRDSQISDNDHIGIALLGKSNQVSETQANNNNYGNIAIVSVIDNMLTDGGNNNTISNVTANGSNTSHGIYIGSDSNTVSESEANNNEVSGIRIGPEGMNNNMSGNMAFDNNLTADSGFDRDGSDLSDPNPVCVNSWQDHDFDTSDSLCIE